MLWGLWFGSKEFKLVMVRGEVGGKAASNIFWCTVANTNGLGLCVATPGGLGQRWKDDNFVQVVAWRGGGFPGHCWLERGAREIQKSAVRGALQWLVFVALDQRSVLGS